MTPDRAIFLVSMYVLEHGQANAEMGEAIEVLERLVVESRGEPVRLNDCGHQCFIIGGPFIAQDPNCPVHGDRV